MSATTLATTTQPPSSNTGANPPLQLLVFDWYEASFPGGTDPLTCAHTLARAVTAAAPTSPHGGYSWKVVRGAHGWVSGLSLQGLEVGSVTLMWGGRPEVHATFTGPAALFGSDLLRSLHPEHTVSRADVAYDVDEPGAFDRIYKRVHEMAREGAAGGGRKVTTETAGDWLDLERGRTFYAGGRTSRLRIRVYEKGHEQRARDEFCGASLDWVRTEWQLRPDSRQSAWLATASPLDALGLTPFGARVAEAIVSENVEAVGSLLRFASQDPAYWMARQYRRVVLALLELDPEEIRDRLVQLVEQTTPQTGADVLR